MPVIYKLGKILFAVLALQLLSGCEDERLVRQAKLDDCVNHYQAESYRVAIRTCTLAAEADIQQAQWLLGHIYFYDLTGEGANTEQAIHWLSKAADNGMVDAQSFVGRAYANGEGIDQDFDKAYQYLMKAAESKNPQAEFALGSMFYQGQGQDKDFSSAIHWYKRAASSGHAMSMNNLAWIYATSARKQIRDPKKALFWAEKLDIGGAGDDKLIFIDTKAAAFASAGDFEKAIALQNQAIAILPEDVSEEKLLDFQQRLEAYQQQQAWIEKD